MWILRALGVGPKLIVVRNI